MALYRCTVGGGVENTLKKLKTKTLVFNLISSEYGAENDRTGQLEVIERKNDFSYLVLKPEYGFEHNIGILSAKMLTRWQATWVEETYIKDNKLYVTVNGSNTSNAGSFKYEVVLIGI